MGVILWQCKHPNVGAIYHAIISPTGQNVANYIASFDRILFYCYEVKDQYFKSTIETNVFNYISKEI